MTRQWAADIFITEKLVRSLLQEQFPELTPMKVKPFGEGWDNALFLVNDLYVFRFPRRSIAVELLEMENRLLPSLAQLLPLPIPNPQLIGRPTENYPFVFAGYQRLQGTVSYVMKLTEETRAKSAVPWARFLRALHSVSVEDALQWGIAATDQIGRMDVDKRRPLYITKVQEAYETGLIGDPKPLLRVLDDLPDTVDVQSRANNVVVHGDLNFRNFLLDGEGVLCGVIDWGDAHIGHSAVDLSVIYSFLPLQAREEFFKVYGAVDSETLHLAKFRALYTNLVILLYANDIGHLEQVHEAKRALRLALS